MALGEEEAGRSAATCACLLATGQRPGASIASLLKDNERIQSTQTVAPNDEDSDIKKIKKSSEGTDISEATRNLPSVQVVTSHGPPRGDLHLNTCACCLETVALSVENIV
ncbi:hypothetical protein P7K49_013053 [Saguinus oedipus]|uniref:Uncharacterized protein n=1 Tax=Saguinus oedipus TaxID=9490 RepID=A0ABQ9VGX9_SAGOE|nr:hypothetical protein P7K49_013053 [Saguinus oedipus]